MKIEELLAEQYLKRYPSEATKVLEKLQPEQCAEILERLDPQTTANVFREMPSWLVEICIQHLPHKQVANVFALLPMSLCALFLRRTDPQIRQNIFDNMVDENRDRIERLLSFPEKTAGALMNALAPRLPNDTTIRQALDHLNRLKHRVYSYLYVVDRNRKFLGYVAVWELFDSNPNDTLSSIVLNDRGSISPFARHESLLNHPGWEKTDELPVVDANGFFLGAVQHRTVRSTQSSDSKSDTIDTPLTAILDLGELYATTMHGLVQSLTTPPDLNQISSSSKTGESHG